MGSTLIKNSQTILSNPFASDGKKIKSSIAARAFGKVAVLMGGTSGERAVSLESGRAVLEALQRQGVDAQGIDTGAPFIDKLTHTPFDLVFNMVHGRQGEDGEMQGLLGLLGLPYVGSQAAASALAMDKARSKMLWLTLNLPTAPFGLAHTLEEAICIAKELNVFPLSVKPNQEGSSLGITKVAALSELPQAFNEARQYGPVLIEKWIEGSDYFVSIVDDEVYPAVQVSTQGGFYDYHAKYQSDQTKYLCPAPLSDVKASELANIAKAAFYSLGCQGWGRVDLVKDHQDQFWILEMNTIPGMSSHSLVPMSARAAGMTFDELAVKILSTAFIDQDRKTKQQHAASKV